MSQETNSYALGEGVPHKHKDDHTSISFHSANLFDQDEDAAGNLVDDATGKPIDNSTALAIEGLNVINDHTLGRERHVSRNDAADQWLKDNDPDHPEYTGNSTDIKKPIVH